MRLVYEISPEARLIIVESVVKQMLSFRQQRWWQAEAGGVLLGRHLLDSNNVIVDEITVPQKNDRSSRYSFFRSEQHSLRAYQRWKAEKGTLAFLGLWHTHPERSPLPSSIDRKDWDNAVVKDIFEGERLYFPIVGIEHIRVWGVARDGAYSELTKLTG